ncbi:DUF418 domain-containing protein [Nonomuraea terrae]
MQTSPHEEAPPHGMAARALAPDLARGVMLLAIALAHAPLFVVTANRGSAVANEIAGFFYQLFVHNHARPMFAFLFGYALVQLMDRELRRGNDWVSIRKLQRRRGWWLVAIGFVHVAVLVPIDILAVYGVAAVLLAGLLRAKDAMLLWAAGISLALSTFVVGYPMWRAMSHHVAAYTMSSIAAGDRDFGEMFLSRIQDWPYGVVVGVVSITPGVIVGMWAARRRLLDQPAQHRRFLLHASVLTTVVSIAGGVPAALIQEGEWTRPSDAAVWIAALAQAFTGFLGGIGMAAIMALIAIVAVRRRKRLTTAVEALGQRSLTLYLFQSVAFVAVFHPYGLGLQDELGLTGALGVAAATWLVSLLIADLMRRAGHRGPAEILLRRLAYRR